MIKQGSKIGKWFLSTDNTCRLACSGQQRSTALSALIKSRVSDFAYCVLTFLLITLAIPAMAASADAGEPATPQASFTVDGDSGEVGQWINFENTTPVIDGVDYNYHWDFGDGWTSTTKSPAHKYTELGTYTATLTVTANGSSTQASKTITVTPDITPPRLDRPTFGYQGAPLPDVYILNKNQYYNQYLGFVTHDFSGISRVTVIFANRELSVGFRGRSYYEFMINPFSFSNGDHELKITVVDELGNISSFTSLIKIDLPPTPQASFTVDVDSGEAPLTVTFENTTSVDDVVYNYHWDFGDGAYPHTSKSPAHEYIEPGTYTATLTVSGRGSTQASKIITVTPDVTPPTITRPSLTYGGDPIPDELVIQGRVSLYLDRASDASEPRGIIPSVELAGMPLTVRYYNYKPYVEIHPEDFSNGDHEFKITATDRFGNISTFTSLIKIDLSPPPQASFTVDVDSGEAALIVNFENTTPKIDDVDLNYRWDFGDGGGSDSENTTHKYTEPGTYTVTLTVSSRGSTQASKIITVTPDVTPPTITRPTLGHYGDPIPDELVIVNSYVNLVFEASDANGLSAIELPRVELSGVPVNVGIYNGKYTTRISVADFANGDYELKITAKDRVGNISTFTSLIKIDVPLPPQASFTVDVESGEAPLAVTFQNTTPEIDGIVDYLWDFGDGLSYRYKDPPPHTYTEPGTYRATLRASNRREEFTEVSNILIRVTPDITPPTISRPRLGGYRGNPIPDELVIQDRVALYIETTDASGLQGTPSAQLSGVPLTRVNYWSGSVFYIDPKDFANGDYELKITAIDKFGNMATYTSHIRIGLPAPDAPVFDSLPQRTNEAEVRVIGHSPLGTEAQFTLNGVAQSDWIPVTDRVFEADFTLIEGLNTITAVARNSIGTSPVSDELRITLDTSQPEAPSGLTANALSQGKVRLSWTPSRETASVGYHIWRSTTSFSDPAQATLLTSSPISAVAYDDLPPTDGSYYYRVASVNDVGTYSLLSNEVEIGSDNTPPTALSITYTSLGKVDAATGRYGQGRINMVLTTSEALQTVPYVSIVPQGGTPITVQLLKTSETVYGGNFLIDANTPAGVANVLFSARDLVGNRGTEVLAGGTLQIDTEGPVLSDITLDPGAPIKNDTAQTVQLTFAYSQPPSAPPQIKYQLSGPLRTAVDVSNLSSLDDTTYTASITLPSDAGMSRPEILSFSHLAQDDLDNVSSKVLALNSYQIYQGDLPPLVAPFGFNARAQPGGKVELKWQEVTDASAYQIYRQSPGELMQALVRTADLEYIDQTPSDGRYHYAVAAVRQANSQESLSAQTSAIEVNASATAPGAPQNLSLTLTGRGIYAAWQPPLSSLVDYYNLYRSTGTVINDIDGLTPHKTRIKTPQTYDTNPSPTEGAYVVTAVDAVGNESAISNSAYLNASLLPVRNVRIEQLDSELPKVSWSAPNGNVSGYLVYVGPDDAKTKLTPNPITTTHITDTGFTSGDRRYTIASVDVNGVEMPRAVTLPSVSSEIVSGLPIKRGVMNRLQVQVTNLSAVSLSGVRVVVRLPINQDGSEFKDHKSENLVLSPNQTLLVPVIVGGYTDLPGAPSAQVGVEISADEGEWIKIARSQTIDVTDGSLVVGIATEDFTRGATGKVKLTIENTSDVDIELLTATRNGSSESTELRLKLLDADGNILSTQAYKQALGANVVTLVNGLTVARIAAGSRYVSESFNMQVPSASPNNVRVRLEVDKLRYHSGQEDEVTIAGRGSERTVTLLDTAYSGEVTQVSPISSFGDEDIIITGRAIDRSSASTMPNTQLKLILNQQGFERSFNILTDASGEFVYTFKPTVTDGGEYKVSAVHPDITDRPEQKTFTINRVSVDPANYNLNVPKNYPFTIPLKAYAGTGSSVTNLRLVLNAASQPSGQIPEGINLELPAPLSLTDRQRLNLPVKFTANNDVQASGVLVLDVISDEHADTPIGQVRVNYTIAEAKPHLVSTPSVVETGLSQGGSQIESVTVENKGLQDAHNLQFTLTKADGDVAPAWASIGNSANGTLAIGESRNVDLAFSPPSGTTEGIYEFKLTVSGDNVPTQSLNVYVSLTQSGQGNVLFKASDIYTATVGEDGSLIQGLSGATISLQNEDVTTVSQQLVTDSFGEALFQDVPAGRYKFRARARDHQETGGRLIIKPGVTANQPVFLDYNLITVEWSVREISIQDRYEITLHTTFETDVPAAVIVLQPSSVNLPKMAAGDVYYGELNLTNYGLVRADNVTQQLPKSDEYFRFEFLADIPSTLEAKQHVTIPYRVVALKSLEDEADSGDASGGGCYRYSNVYSVGCNYACANGTVSSSGSSTGFYSFSNSSCSGGGSGGGVGGGGSSGGGGIARGWGGSFGGGSSPPGTTIKTDKMCARTPRGVNQCQ